MYKLTIDCLIKAQHTTPMYFANLFKPLEGSPEIDCLRAVGKTNRNRGVSKRAAKIILASWRSNTRRCYRSALQKWLHFCGTTEANPIRPNVTTVVDFLASVFNSGIGYSSLDTLRSALSAAVLPVDGVAMGSHPLVKRLMKGLLI